MPQKDPFSTAVVGDISATVIPSRALAEFSLFHKEEADKRAIALLSLPAVDVARSYGIPTAIWVMYHLVAARAPVNASCEWLAPLGISSKSFDIGMTTSQYFNGTNLCFKDCMSAFPQRCRTIELISAHCNQKALALPLEPILLKNLKSSRMLTRETLLQYTLEPVTADDSTGWCSNWQEVRSSCKLGTAMYDIYLDGPFGLVLKYQERPLAVLGCRINNENCLTIVQMQGVTPTLEINTTGHPITPQKLRRELSPWPLEPFTFSELMIDISIEYARCRGFTHVILRNATHNPWICTDNQVSRRILSTDRGNARYDIAPQKKDLLLTERETGRCAFIRSPCGDSLAPAHLSTPVYSGDSSRT